MNIADDFVFFSQTPTKPLSTSLHLAFFHFLHLTFFLLNELNPLPHPLPNQVPSSRRRRLTTPSVADAELGAGASDQAPTPWQTTLPMFADDSDAGPAGHGRQQRVMNGACPSPRTAGARRLCRGLTRGGRQLGKQLH